MIFLGFLPEVAWLGQDWGLGKVRVKFIERWWLLVPCCCGQIVLRKLLANFVDSGPAMSLCHRFLNTHVFLLDPLDRGRQVRGFLFLLFLCFFLRGSFISFSRGLLFLLLFLSFLSLGLGHSFAVLVDVDDGWGGMVENWPVDRFTKLQSWLKILCWCVKFQFWVILSNTSNHGCRLWSSCWLVFECWVERTSERSVHFYKWLCCWPLSIWKHLWILVISLMTKNDLLISRLGAGLCLLRSGLVIVVG